MYQFFAHLIDDEGGATAIEYGLIVALIAVAILTALTAFADTSTGIFNGAMNAIKAAMSGSA